MISSVRYSRLRTLHSPPTSHFAAQYGSNRTLTVVLEEGMDLKLVQGPFADVLTHIGQLHAMRRRAGSAVAPANYIKATVNVGRISLDAQPD